MTDRERLIKKGSLVELKNRLEQLKIRAERAATDIRIYLFSEDGVDGLELDKADQAFSDLKRVVAEYKEIRDKVKRLEDELYG